MKEKFIENNIEYILAEDGIYYPNLKLLKDNKTRPIGLYGSLRRTYLKDHRPALFMDFLLSGTLTKHLADTNDSAHERLGVYWSSFLVTLCSEIMLYIETPLVSYSYSLNEVSHSCTS